MNNQCVSISRAGDMVKVRPLSAELQKVAIDELSEVPSRIPEDLQALKQWVALQPHLKARLDDQFLIQFLRGCKYSLERAKEKLDMHFSYKSKYPEMFNLTNVDEPMIREFIRAGNVVILPEPINGNGPRVVLFKINYDGSEKSRMAMYQLSSGVYDYILVNDPYACIQGLFYIIDLGKTSPNHFLKISPSIIKQCVWYHLKTLPLRFKGGYFINSSTTAQNFFKMVYPVLPEKMTHKMHVLGNDFSEMQQEIPLKYLPSDYGGSQPSIAELSEKLNKILDENRDYFKENALYGTNEELRPGKPLDFDGLSGVGGSFRKLTTD